MRRVGDLASLALFTFAGPRRAQDFGVKSNISGARHTFDALKPHSQSVLDCTEIAIKSRFIKVEKPSQHAANLAGRSHRRYRMPATSCGFDLDRAVLGACLALVTW